MTKYPTGAPDNPEEMWKIHKGIAIRVADKYHKKYPEYLTFDEKLSHACIGMIQCLDKWDPNRGIKFVTYAHQAMCWVVERAIAKEKCYHYPGPVNDPGKYEVRHKYTDYKDRVRQDGRRDSSIQADLYAANQVSYQQVEEKLDFDRKIDYIRTCLDAHYLVAFELMLRDGLSYSEAAVEVGVSREAMRRKLKAAIEEMKEYYEEATPEETAKDIRPRLRQGHSNSTGR